MTPSTSPYLKDISTLPTAAPYQKRMAAQRRRGLALPAAILFLASAAGLAIGVALGAALTEREASASLGEFTVVEP